MRTPLMPEASAGRAAVIVEVSRSSVEHQFPNALDSVWTPCTVVLENPPELPWVEDLLFRQCKKIGD